MSAQLQDIARVRPGADRRLPLDVRAPQRDSCRSGSSSRAALRSTRRPACAARTSLTGRDSPTPKSASAASVSMVKHEIAAGEILRGRKRPQPACLPATYLARTARASSSNSWCHSTRRLGTSTPKLRLIGRDSAMPDDRARRLDGLIVVAQRQTAVASRVGLVVAVDVHVAVAAAQRRRDVPAAGGRSSYPTVTPSAT